MGSVDSEAHFCSPPGAGGVQSSDRRGPGAKGHLMGQVSWELWRRLPATLPFLSAFQFTKSQTLQGLEGCLCLLSTHCHFQAREGMF